jgi:hypothetical protein
MEIVNRWASELDVRLSAYRRMTYSAALALEEIRSLQTSPQGLLRLISDGSLLWLALRPFAICWRSLRRQFRRPYWLATESASDPD